LVMLFLGLLALLIVPSLGHGVMTLPTSNRHGGTLETAGDCSEKAKGGCLWFSQITVIPGEPTLPSEYRTYNIDVDSGPRDWSRSYPWRSPGAAPVLGSGCGIAGGNPVVLFNGGVSPAEVPQGMDGLKLAPQKPVVWKRGASVEVAFALTANHGGGYSYRLCKADGVVDEACFQKTVLKFAGDMSAIEYSSKIVPGGPRIPIPLVKVTKGTNPPGSEWARNPVPACNFCNQAPCGNPLLMPNFTEASGTLAWGNEIIPYYGGKQWIDEVRCGVVCAGEDKNETFANNTKVAPSGQLCGGKTQFKEPLVGLSGFVVNATYPALSITAFSVVDTMLVPTDIEPGSYLLSWRWDCEQSPQIWQNCADILIQ